MTVWGILVAAGAGRRFGGPKHGSLLAGRELWTWGRDALLAGGVAEIVTVGDVPGGVPGGERRRESVAAGLAEIPPSVEYVLVHDAARPLADAELVRRVIARLTAGDVDGVVPVVPLRDTVKAVAAEEVTATIERGPLVAVQTPQGFRAETLRRAHQASDADVTDDAALLEAIGATVVTVPGDPRNLKITYQEDLVVAEALKSAVPLPASTTETRIGWGFDAHRFGGPAPIKLGGVVVDEKRGLEATSDGDVACHAVADALLGAAALGDLGTYFPSADPQWKGADSLQLLARVASMLGEGGFGLGAIDVTVISQSVPVAPFREEMRKRLADVLGIDLGRVSVKATTTDRMGAVGADEGIAAVAVATLRS